MGVLELPEQVRHISGRTSIGESGTYYKGVGASYNGHCTLDPSGYAESNPCDVFYYGYEVKNRNWIGKFGIFDEKLQPYFSDRIGSCGPKEDSIKEKSLLCPISNVVVTGFGNIPYVDNQRYYCLEYKSKRDPWLGYGLTNTLRETIEVLLSSGWNFPWDKASIRDINRDGSITDVADMFHSYDYCHQLGTVYSVLYSLYVLDKERFITFIRSQGLIANDPKGLLFSTLGIMDSCGVSIQFAVPQNATSEWDIYNHLAANCLMTGRNCGHVENIETGNEIAKQYQERFYKQIGSMDTRRTKKFRRVAA